MSFFFLKIQLGFYSLKTRKQLRNEKMGTLIQNLCDGIILLDLDLKIVYINSQALNLLNWEFSNVYQTSFLNHFEAKIVDLFLLKIKSLFKKKRNLLSEKYSETHKEINLQSIGILNRTILIIFKIAFEKEKVVGVIITIRDISKEIKINKKKIKILSTISHELRTPLFNIQSFIHTLDQYSNRLDQKEIKEFLEITNKEISRLSRLVNTILDFSKFNYKNLYLFSAIDINEVFNQVIQVYSIRARQKKVKIRKEIEQNLSFILGKKDLLFQVFDNLLGNALKFSNYNSIIVFRAYKISNNNLNKIRVEICDTGWGIKKKDQEKIFKRFSRINNETKIIYGTGLGLSIVKKILQKHGSKVRLSSNINEGTIFFIDFILTVKN